MYGLRWHWMSLDVTGYCWMSLDVAGCRWMLLTFFFRSYYLVWHQLVVNHNFLECPDRNVRRLVNSKGKCKH